MEKITKRDGRYYYGEDECDDVEDAYGRFRVDYHSILGRVARQRLDRTGSRAERIHGFGFVFDEPVRYDGCRRKANYRMLGLIGIHYFRVIGCWDYGFVDDDQFDTWLEAAFSRGSGMLRMVGVAQKTGRTKKNNRRRIK